MAPRGPTARMTADARSTNPGRDAISSLVTACRMGIGRTGGMPSLRTELLGCAEPVPDLDAAPLRPVERREAPLPRRVDVRDPHAAVETPHQHPALVDVEDFTRPAGGGPDHSRAEQLHLGVIQGREGPRLRIVRTNGPRNGYRV